MSSKIVMARSARTRKRGYENLQQLFRLSWIGRMINSPSPMNSLERSELMTNWHAISWWVLRIGGFEILESTMKPLVTDALWERIEPLLPPPSPRRFRFPGRKHIDQRKVLTGILFVLKTGIAWDDLPSDMGCGCGKTCRH